jgi:hypothetical protein
MDTRTLNWRIVEPDVRGIKGALDELHHRSLHWPLFVWAKRVVTMAWNLLFLAFRFVCIILLHFTDFAVPILTEGSGPIGGSLLATAVPKL